MARKVVETAAVIDISPITCLGFFYLSLAGNGMAAMGTGDKLPGVSDFMPLITLDEVNTTQAVADGNIFLPKLNDNAHLPADLLGTLSTIVSAYQTVAFQDAAYNTGGTLVPFNSDTITLRSGIPFTTLAAPGTLTSFQTYEVVRDGLIIESGISSDNNPGDTFATLTFSFLGTNDN